MARTAKSKAQATPELQPVLEVPTPPIFRRFGSELPTLAKGCGPPSQRLRLEQTHMNSPPAEIQRLHQQDIDAPVLMDVGKLASLWAEDGVLLSQGDEPLVGKAAIEASLKRTLAANPTMEVIKYVLE